MSIHALMALHLETDRLTLRPFAEADAAELAALVAERGKGRPTVERAREVIAEGSAATARNGLALLRIERREEGDFVGYCGLLVGRATAEEPEIAYELLRHAHGRGYATEAARAVVDAAAASGRKRLWATVRPDNAPSFRVLEKLGFERDRVAVEEDGEHVWLARVLS